MEFTFNLYVMGLYVKSSLQCDTFYILFSTEKLMLHAQKMTSGLNQLMETLRREDISFKQCRFIQSCTYRVFLLFSLCRCQWSVWLWACWVCFEEQHHPGMETALYSGRANPGDWLYHAYTRAGSEVNMGLFFFFSCSMWFLVIVAFYSIL